MDESLSPRPRRTVRRRLLLFSALGLIPLLFAGYYLYSRHSSEVELADALAEADQSDPNWRLADLEAQRQEVPDSENAFLQARAAYRLLPRPCPSWFAQRAVGESEEAWKARQAVGESFDEIEPPVRLNDLQTQALRRELQPAQAGLREARKLVDRPHGIQHLKWTRDYLSTILQSSQDTRQVASILHYDALLQAQDRDFAQGLRSARAALNCGRALGDEPTGISQLIRAANDNVAWSTMERVLAQGESGPADLLAAQQALEEEAEEPLLSYGLRGERGVVDSFMEKVQSGELSLKQIDNVLAMLPGRRNDPFGERLEILTLKLTVREQRAKMLHYMNQLVEIARLSPEEQVPRLKEVEANSGKQLPPWFVRITGPLPGKLGQAANRIRAQLRCASVALAAERYRQGQDRWPRTLDELVPQYIARIPLDPFDGQPLKLGKHAQGIVIYSVGFDGRDNGGIINVKSPMAAGSDLGFRLWDVTYRRQPAESLEATARTEAH